MTRRKEPEQHFHGPENAEHEIKKAYNSAIETGVTHFWDRRVPGVAPDEVFTVYKHAFHRLRDGNRLAAERWARSAKHLSRAFWHEAKIAYLEPRANELPFLSHAREEYDARDHSDTTADLLDSLADHVPPGMDEMPEEMRRYLSRARRHLQVIESQDYRNELLRAERIEAAHEYGRVLECMALAYEAEGNHQGKVA